MNDAKKPSNSNNQVETDTAKITFSHWDLISSRSGNAMTGSPHRWTYSVNTIDYLVLPPKTKVSGNYFINKTSHKCGAHYKVYMHCVVHANVPGDVIKQIKTSKNLVAMELINKLKEGLSVRHIIFYYIFYLFCTFIAFSLLGAALAIIMGKEKGGNLNFGWIRFIPPIIAVMYKSRSEKIKSLERLNRGEEIGMTINSNNRETANFLDSFSDIKYKLKIRKIELSTIPYKRRYGHVNKINILKNS